MSFTQSTMLWCIVFALIGAHAYVADRKIGVSIYAFFRKWTTPPNTPQGPQRGFIYNRSHQFRFFVAGIIAGLNAAVMIGWRHEDPRVEIMLWFLITPATFIGFLGGPLYVRFTESRKKFFHTLDQVESGELDVTGEVRKVAGEKISAANRLMDRIAAYFAAKKFVWEKVAKQETSTAATATAAPPISKEEELKKARDFLKRFQ